MSRPKLLRLPVIAIAEWLMVLPAGLFLAAAALRLLQPRQYQPAHISWIVFEWSTAHISRLGAAVLFLVIPALVALVGCSTLWLVWRQDQVLRHDTTLAFAILRRHLVPGLLTTATLLAGAILMFAGAHIIAD